MLKKLSLILAAVSLCTNLGIVTPVSAETETEETVLLESNFQNCNLGIYTEENQKDGETDLRSGVVMTDESTLTTGYTIKNEATGEYEPISEADIVDDDGTKVLRLNTFLKQKYDITSTEKYPILQTDADFPNSGKVKIELEIKVNYATFFYMYHSGATLGGNRRIWRLQRGTQSEFEIKLQDNSPSQEEAPKTPSLYDQYYKLTVIMDAATAKMSFFKNDKSLGTLSGVVSPASDWQLYLEQANHNDIKPSLTYNTEDKTKIDSVENPQYVYIKSLKVTTHTDAALESVTPANDSTVVAPEEAVFNFSGNVTGVGTATVTAEGSKPVTVTSKLNIKGKTVTVPYAFEDNVTYTVKLEGVRIGLSSLDAETTFKVEPWKFSNISKNPVSSSDSGNDSNVYFVNEGFEASDDSNLIVEGNSNYGWCLNKSKKASIVVEDGTQALQIEKLGSFTIKHDETDEEAEEIGLDNTTTLSYRVKLGANAKNFNVKTASGAVANWRNGYYDYNGAREAAMTAGEWHDVKLTISDTATTIYVDDAQLMNIYGGVSPTEINEFTFEVTGDSAIIDDLKLYLDKNQAGLADIYPAYDATDISLSDAIELTYSSEIGDVSGAKLTIKPNDTDEPTVLTDGEGMTVSKDGEKVTITLDKPLEKNTGYGLEISGLKGTSGLEIEAVKTRFSTVADPAWAVSDFAATAEGTSKTYSIKVKNETDAAGARMAVAVYDENGNLKEVKFSDPAPEAANEWKELNATVNYATGDTSKIFIWDSLEDMNLINAIITD